METVIRYCDQILTDLLFCLRELYLDDCGKMRGVPDLEDLDSRTGPLDRVDQPAGLDKEEAANPVMDCAYCAVRERLT